MSFGNRSNFASLSDAYGIDSFTQQEEESYKLKEPVEEYPVVQPKENFNVEEEHHCKGCSCHSRKLKPWINEILNMILIFLLLWVIVYSPYV